MITFYENATGYNHTLSGKPCQDKGVYYEQEGVYIAVVCDGHGSDTYVRSHDGARLAAEIAKEEVLSFIKEDHSALFLGKRGAVPARPTVNLLKDKHGNSVQFSSLSEGEQEIVLQNVSYSKESQKHPKVEEAFRNLFQQITDKWYAAIDKDSKEKPFTSDEKQKLGERDLTKAYGTTLMVAARTPLCWFAFQIGDGKVLIFDKRAQWAAPVPRDCNCFLNVTTSLCDPMPVSEFRYAFDGTGEFPVAFFLCCDGVDGTLFEDDILYHFYGQMLAVFRDYTKEEALGFLRDYLPKLSEKGSHDDMSIAGIIDESTLAQPLEYYTIIAEVRAFNKEKEKREKEIQLLEEKQHKVEKSITPLREDYFRKCREKDSWWRIVLRDKAKVKEELAAKKEKWLSAQEVEQQTAALITTKQQEYEEWTAEKKQREEELRSRATALAEKLGLKDIPEEISRDTAPKENTEQEEDKKTVVPQPQAITPEENDKLENESEQQVTDILDTQNT